MITATEQQRRDSTNPQTFPALCAAILMLVCIAVAAQAQSGRSVRRQEPAGTPAEDDGNTQTPSDKSSTKPPKDFTFIVTKYVQSPTVAVETSTAFSSFVERLSKSSAVEVVTVGRETTRKEAIDRAKLEEKENSYVVWLRVEVDTMDTELAAASIPLNPSCLLVSYTV